MEEFRAITPEDIERLRTAEEQSATKYLEWQQQQVQHDLQILRQEEDRRTGEIEAELRHRNFMKVQLRKDIRKVSKHHLADVINTRQRARLINALVDMLIHEDEDNDPWVDLNAWS